LNPYLKVQTAINFYLTITDVPNGSVAFSYANRECLQSFVFNKLVQSATSSINGINFNISPEMYIDELLRAMDKESVNEYNQTTPALSDSTYGLFSDGVGTNSSVLASESNSSYCSVKPRGCFNNMTILIEHYDAANNYLDTSNLSTSNTDYWYINITANVIEPVIIPPFKWNHNNQNNDGMMGINIMTINYQIDSALTRIFSTANTTLTGTALTSKITSITAGSKKYGVDATSNLFTTPTLLTQWYSLSDLQKSKLTSKKNVHHYIKYVGYPYTYSSTILANTTATITSNSIQLSSIPNLIKVFVRLPNTTTNYMNYVKNYLTITNISINFAGKQSILAPLNQWQLYDMSRKNGLSSINWNEFSGTVISNNNTTGNINSLASIGSIIYIDPSKDLQLPSGLTNNSQGNFSLIITVQVKNQNSYSIVQPQMIILCENDYSFTLEPGTGSSQEASLTAGEVLKVKQSDTDTMKDTDVAMMGGSKIGIVKRYFRKKGKKMGVHMMGKEGGQLSGGQLSGGMSRLGRHIR
jgi:hypothetical protein